MLSHMHSLTMIHSRYSGAGPKNSMNQLNMRDLLSKSEPQDPGF